MWIRIKKPDMELIVFDPEGVDSFTIDLDGDDKLYYLTAFRSNSMIFLCEGTFSECHHVLNQITKKLKLSITDL